MAHPYAALLVPLLIALLLLFKGRWQLYIQPSVTQLELRHLPGFFAQDYLTRQNASEFDFLQSGLGLLDQRTKYWRRFTDRISSLAKEDPESQYKLIVVGRHGQGYHNVAEEKYGTTMWDCHWSEEYGDGTITWGPDANLTDFGRFQASQVKEMWSRELEAGMPAPQRFFTSPLSRAITTMSITFSGLIPGFGDSVAPIVIEDLRESIGLHTCDQRSTKSKLQARFPFLQFEAGFSETDSLWEAKRQEPKEAQDQRTFSFLKELFDKQKDTYISITAHGGTIESLFTVTGHPVYGVTTGSVVPMVVKASLTQAPKPPSPPSPSWAGKPACPSGTEHLGSLRGGIKANEI